MKISSSSDNIAKLRSEMDEIVGELQKDAMNRDTAMNYFQQITAKLENTVQENGRKNWLNI